ncbi:hypothetical protein [Palleronia abyssalis]|uniref:Uncharacterized protein n=1 Tax=Palleronia abyssalis TaxID=1501240 RepID=A0A2R8BUN3_9RHOB|nr:hypothetical protein [Palleronia abyssalis]SPJ23850.1 hypothetical protein PAA8504_01668 [Palleronia abyssalis]
MNRPVFRPETPPPGAAPVRRRETLSAPEAWWLRALRLWDGPPDGRVELAEDLTIRFGAARAKRLLARFGELFDLVSQTARRPLAIHAPSCDCDCVGSDEAVFALFCSTATHGPREDAMMIACLILRPDVAPLAVSLAQSLGLELDRSLRASVR